MILCTTHDTFNPSPAHRGFAISEFAKKRRETFVKRTFARDGERFPTLPLRRDLTRVWHDAMGFRTLAIWLLSAFDVSLGS